MNRSYQIHLEHDLFKFACAHMTVFPDGRKERLHGHNYYVSVDLSLADIRFDRLIEFATVKKVIAELCAAWRERTLVAAHNPHFVLLRHDQAEIEFTLCGKRYLLPAEDALVLPVDNITVEALSAHFADLLLQRLGPILQADIVQSVEVTVSESAKQGATCRVGTGST